VPASLGGILSVAKSGLLTQQLALQVTSQNLANATTEGYSRQRPDLVAGTPLAMPEGLLGTGVRVADITRARNTILDRVYRRESSLSFGFQTEYDALNGVESALGEPGDFGLGVGLDAFWNSWSDLANDPTSSTARSVVAARGQQLVDQFRRIDAELDAVGTQVTDALIVSVDEVNRVLGEIANANAAIATAVSGGNSAPDLADQRDRLLDELATYTPITVTQRDNGAVGVSINGISVVEGTIGDRLSLVSASGVWSVQTTSGTALSLESGRVGGALTTLNGDFATMRVQLDELAQGLVERVNAIHASGTNPLGATGVNFFDDFGDPSTVTAQTLSLDAAILADSQAVVAGTPDGGGNYRSGANGLALALAGLRDDTTGGVLSGRSVGDAYRDLVADVGISVAGAREAEASHRTLTLAAAERRESVSGVATDEELIKVVQIQAAYTAAARLISVVDEMYQTILSI
jgi:flagellar hook-associated protein 1